MKGPQSGQFLMRQQFSCSGISIVLAPPLNDPSRLTRENGERKRMEKRMEKEDLGIRGDHMTT